MKEKNNKERMITKTNMLKIFYLLVVMLLMSCKHAEINDPAKYLNYLADPENGLVREKTIGSIKFKVKYLPPAYLAYNVLKDNTLASREIKDSLINSYKGSLTFLLNIGPAKGENFDITRLGVSSYQDFAERIETMAFEAQEWMQITVNGVKHKPTIARLENINAPENSRNFVVVFEALKAEEKDDLCFIYNDELFNTGTNKFIFKTDDIQNLPVFRF